MPVFVPGVTKQATAGISLPVAGLDCTAELWLGPNEDTKSATSGRRPFVSSITGTSVPFPIQMPSQPGVYHVYIDAYLGNDLIPPPFVGTDDVALISVVIESPVWS